MRVGVCWAGSKGHLNDHNRSMRLEELTPVFLTPDTSFVSLQIGDRADDADDVYLLASCSRPERVDRQISDFAGTARVIHDLDLVITVDTAIAHLAGALGVPVWILLPTNPDFRWMNEGDTTPWYPSARLFRQTKRGQWADVIERVAHELRQLTP